MPMQDMPKTLTAAAALLLWLPLSALAQVHKCTVNGVVTYQSTPCAAAAPRRQPTVDELNAERRKKLAQQAAQAAGDAAGPRLKPEPPRQDTGPTADKRAPAAGAAFRCDGRTHCSQMTSCAEATYFLAHCPGVSMDGDNDGVPCEQQWCRW